MATVQELLGRLKKSGVEVQSAVGPQGDMRYIVKRGNESFGLWGHAVQHLAEKGKLTWSGIKEYCEKK